MKNYTITVNGNVYEVTVEEGQATGAVIAPAAKPVVAAPKKEAPKATGAQGGIQIVSPMPGKILGIKVQNGQKVEKGQVVMILEAMKMENEIVAQEAGTVASINVNEGASVEAGQVLATLN